MEFVDDSGGGVEVVGSIGDVGGVGDGERIDIIPAGIESNNAFPGVMEELLPKSAVLEMLTNELDRGIKSEQFMVTLDGLCIFGNVLFLDSSCFIWIGSGETARMGRLDVTVPTKYDPMPLTTTLINESENDVGSQSGLFGRLARRFRIQIFSSSNVEIDNPLLWQLVEKKLVEMLAVFG